jgi:hypothetical protein
MKTAPLALSMALLVLSACTDTGSGNVAFTTWGEELIEEGIPATVFADGWSVKYDRFLVVLSGVKVADGATVAGEMGTARLFNHVVPRPKPVVDFPSLTAKTWPNVSYVIGPAANTELGAGATEADKALMTAGGYGLYVEGKAQKGADSRTFKWGFSAKTLFDSCKGDVSGKEVDGVVVANGGTDTVELTIHGDHLFYDDLQAPEAKVRFQNIADADADKNGEVTLAELEAVKLARLPPANGAYGTGSDSKVVDLKAFVTDLSRTVGHFRGEGECFAKPR